MITDAEWDGMQVLDAVDTEARAEIVNLKQEVAELRKMLAENHMELMSLRGLMNTWARLAMPEEEGETDD